MPSPEIINFHHVGARSGSSVPVLRMLGNEQKIWLYDADESCLEQVREIYKNSVVPVRVIPTFIGEDSGSLDFHLNHDPYTSSCFAYNEALNGAYQATDNNNGDYLFSEAFSEVKVIQMKSSSLDSLSREEGFSVDYLSLDVQAGELNILNGAKRVLDQQCLAINTEILFETYYKGQPHADDIFSLCRENNFRFMRLESHEDSSWFRGPIGWRGKGATFFGDALFYKDPKSVKATHPHPSVSLKKLAMIALTAGYFEFSLECLLLCDASLEARKNDRHSKFKYVRILSGMLDIYEEEHHIYSPSFSEIYPIEESSRRFQGNEEESHRYNKEKLRQRYFSKTSPEQFKTTFPKIFSTERTRLEQYLTDNALAITAEKFRERRIEHARIAAQLLGLMKKDGETLDLDVLDQLGR